MSLIKIILKFVVIFIVIVFFWWILVSNVSFELVEGVENFWSKMQWIIFFMIVLTSGGIYFFWGEIGKHFARKYDRPDAVELFKELKIPVFATFAVVLLLGVVL